MNMDLFILTLLLVSAANASAVYQGCFQVPSNTSNYNITNLYQTLGVQSCMNQSIAVGATAFGLRRTTTQSGFCYTGSLSSLTTNTNLSVVPYCNSTCPGDNYFPCGLLYTVSSTSYFSTISVHTIDCINTTWSAWSTCSQTCDRGVQSRYQILNFGTTCNTSQTKVFQYQSCRNSAQCIAISTRTTTLQSQCTNLRGYYAYSTCYFLANTPGSAATVCANQNAIQASLFGPDLISQLGSAFLQTTNVIGLTSLQYFSGSLQWVLNGTNYPFLRNDTVALPIQSCVSLVSNKNSNGSVPEVPHLNHTACSSTTIFPMCMISDNIYSSYAGMVGKLITEQVTPESVTFELDAHACGARCSRIISCLGFNYRSLDLSCIPTKVSYRTPSTISGIQVYTIQVDPTWTFYDRT